MKTRCPCCGTVNSLDALIAHDDARLALMSVSALGGELASLTIKYCGLFRPAKSSLTFARLAKLIDELLIDMKAQRIERRGECHDAPLEAWAYAMAEMLARREQGKLSLPLPNHGYLYDVIASYKPRQPLAAVSTNVQPKPTSAANKTEVGIAALEAARRELNGDKS